MNLEKDVRSLLNKVIREETMWLRHYEAQVVDNLDSLKKGRVKVIIPELGFYTSDKGMWCFPRQGDSMSIPPIGAWVEIYFVSGNPNKPRYLFYASEMLGMTPINFDGLPSTHIIFEDSNTGDFIKYDAVLKTLTLNFVTGSIENIVLQTGDASSWMPNVIAVCPMTGAPHGGPGAGIVKLKGK